MYGVKDPNNHGMQREVKLNVLRPRCLIIVRVSSSANVDTLPPPGMPEGVLEGMVSVDESSLPGASLLGGIAIVSALSIFFIRIARVKAGN
jgi:hypothetical protein